MRLIYMTMAAVAGLCVAAPAQAQWPRDHSQAPSAPTMGQRGHDRTYSPQLRLQIDAGVSQGTISRRSVGLREDLSQLVRLERRFSPNGISGREHAELMQRSNALAKDIRVASRSHNGRGHPAAWESGSSKGKWV